MDIPIFVDDDEQPVSEKELREVATSILEKGEPGEANHLAQLVLAWMEWKEWKPGGWDQAETPEGDR